MNAMVLAAGLGTRLRPYTIKRPKPLFPLLDTPLLGHTLAQLKSCGAERIVVNAHHLREQIADFCVGRAEVFVQLETLELGTGGGLRLAQPHFGDTPFLAVNGDIVHDLDLGGIHRAHLASDAQVSMVLHDCPRFNNVLVDGRDRILGFARQADAQKGERLLAFTGIQVIDPAVLALIPQGVFFNIIDCYQALLAAGGRIQAQVVRGHYWTDMGTPQDYLELHAGLLSGRRLLPHLAWNGAGPFFLSPRAQVGEGVAFNDWVAVGSRARVGANASLSRVVVWDGAEVPAGGVFRDTIIT
ncbi:nucleotidyltransferase family protein [Thiovibrio sp. JS02]